MNPGLLTDKIAIAVSRVYFEKEYRKYLRFGYSFLTAEFLTPLIRVLPEICCDMQIVHKS